MTNCALLLFACVNAYGQAPALSKFEKDSAEIIRVYTNAERPTDPDSSIQLLRALLPTCIAAKFDRYTSAIYLSIGGRYYDKGDYVQALVTMRQAHPYCTNFLEQSNYFQHIGWVYGDLGDYVTAAENYYKALDYFQRSKMVRPNGVSIYNNLGELYTRLHQDEKALYYFDLGEEYAVRNNYQNSTVFILYNKGEYYIRNHQPDTARKLFKRVNDIGREIPRTDIRAIANLGIGKAYLESKMYDSAIHYLQLAISISAENEKNLTIDISYSLGEALYHAKKYKEAETVLLSALKKATAINYKDNIIEGYNTLTAIYKTTAQYTNALDCMDSIVVLKDSLVSSEKSKAINLMDIKYQTAEKDKQIAEQGSKIARKNMWIFFIGGSIVLLLLVLASAYLLTLNKQKSLEKENKISILKAAVIGGDNERRRIARELHDGIGGMLGAAMMRFSSMQRDNAGMNTTPAYREAMNILSEMGDEIRKTAHNLMPEVLLKQSLPEAIRSYCNDVQTGGPLQIDFQSYGSFDNLTQEYKLNLYRIIQELVKNVIQHAGASKAMVQLVQNDSLLIVSVEDNGAGFNKRKISTGQGLYNTQTRVSSLDGKFTIESTTGNGTSVFIEINVPVPSETGTVQ